MVEFSPAGYRTLLEAAKSAGYQFIGYDCIAQATPPSLLLRHDIDFSMDYAHAMAHIEAEHGVTSTYFVMLRSPVYSLLSRHSSRLLREIVAMGHAVGLHFDAGFTQGEERTQDAWLRFELDMLSQLAGTEVEAFSLHQPTASMIDANINIPGIVNTYHPDHLAGFSYISDSNRDWRGKDVMATLKAREPLQLLIHPMWWISPAATPEGCWDEVIALNFAQAQEQMLATERAYGPKRRLQVVRNDG